MEPETNRGSAQNAGVNVRQLWGQLILTDGAFLGTLDRDHQLLISHFPEHAAPLNHLLEKIAAKGFSEQFFSEFSQFARTITSATFNSSAGQDALAKAIEIINLRGSGKAEKIFHCIKNISPQQVPSLVAFAKVQERLAQYYGKYPDSENTDAIQTRLLERAIHCKWGRKQLRCCREALVKGTSSAVGNEARVNLISALDDRQWQNCARNLDAISSLEEIVSGITTGEDLRSILGLKFLPLLVTSLKNLPMVGYSREEEQRELCAIAAHLGQGTEVLMSWLEKNLHDKSRSPAQLVQWMDTLAEYRSEGLSIEAAIVLESSSSKSRPPAEEISKILLEQYGSHTPMNRLIGAVALFIDRSQQDTGAFEGILSRLVADVIKFQFLEKSFAIEAILKDELRFEKLLLCLEGRGLSLAESVHTREQLSSLLVELEAQHDIYEVLSASTPQNFDFLNNQFVERYAGDNPPFRLLTGERDEPAASEEVQATFMTQIIETFSRHVDSHFGAAANTYNFKHTPVTKVCPIDETALRLQAEISVIASTDIKQFPGPGRVIQNINVGNVFFPDKVDEVFDDYTDWRAYYLKEYGPVSGFNDRGNIHPIDLVGKAKITAFRAGMGISVPQNRFINLDGESATLVDWNHHFDATGAQMATLVATRVFDSFFESSLLPLHGVSPGLAHEAAKRITDNPPTVRALIARSLEMGVFAPVNLSAGSSFSGGLINGLPFGEKNYLHWELSYNEYLDRFGRRHKYHIRNIDYLLQKLHMHHEHIYKCTSALQNVRDIYKLIIGLDARGDTRDVVTKEFNPFRMLEHFCLFTHEFSQVERTKQAPSLVLAPANYWAREIKSPFILDGATGFCFNAWDAPFEVKIRSDGTPSAQLMDWWEERVVPYLRMDENSWIAPRLVDRENLLSQMQMYGYRGK